jgi:ABC-type transporter Mla subunit MlaD
VTLPPEQPHRSLVRLGLTISAAVALLVVLAVVSVRTRGPSGRDAVVVVLPSAPGGLREGDAVTYLGIEAGTIRHIDLSTGRVVLTLALGREDVVLRAADTVRLRTRGLFGDNVVDVTPGPRSAPVVGPGDTIVVPAAYVETPALSPPRLDSVLRGILRSPGRSPDSARPTTP